MIKIENIGVAMESVFANCSVSISELKKNPITGVFLSNELVDAFPVHRIVRDSEGRIK